MNVWARFPVIGYDSRVKVLWGVLQILTVLCCSIVFSCLITCGLFATDLFYWLIIAVFCADILIGLVGHFIEPGRSISHNTNSKL